MRRWLSPLLLALVGASEILVAPPNSIAWVHWVNFSALMLTLDPTSPRRAGRQGWWFGICATVALFTWLVETITTFSNLSTPLALGVLALFSLVFSLPFALIGFFYPGIRQWSTKKLGENAWIWLFPLAWTGVERYWPTLFPYYQGVSQYRTQYVWQLASVFGPHGVSYLLFVSNALIAASLGAAWRAHQEGRPVLRALPWRHIGIFSGVFTAVMGFGVWRWNAIEADLAGAPTYKISLLQQGVTMLERLQDRGEKVLKSWVELTQKAVAKDQPSLVVWPEGSIYYNPDRGKAREILGGLAKQGEFDFLLGGGTSEKDPANPERRLSWNSTYLFNRQGEIAGRYDKMVPLPFGEYLPWPASYLRDYISGPGNFRAGEAPFVFTSGPYRFTVPICYEAILERQMRRLMDNDLYVVITNDGWFGASPGVWAHSMLAATFATSMGRPMVRVAYTGISMVVEPHGKIVEEILPQTEAAKVIPVRMKTYETPYRTWGNWIVHLACVSGIGLGAWGYVSERRSRAVTPQPPAA